MQLNIPKIEAHRKRKKWSKTDLAEKAGISKQLLNHYYQNPRYINNVSVIADALGINPKSLLE